jgi:hypothetical protein
VITVHATREGLIGHKTASNYIIDPYVPFVALPAVKALRRAVRILNPATGLQAIALVLDVGPWNEYDNAYVFEGARPQAESGHDTRHRATNKAGIDLGEWVWHHLGYTDNGPCSWEFVV